MSEHPSVFDFSAIEELDPSLSDGHHICYERDVPFEIRHQQTDSDEQTQGSIETIRVKILLLDGPENPTSIRIELSSESDLFFHFMHIIDHEGYAVVQENQKLMVDFPHYPEILIRMFNSCIREPHIYLGIFTLFMDTMTARLDFIQNMEYKFVELMSCAFTQTPEEIVQHQITYRYNSLKQRTHQLQSRLQEIYSIVKTKNPSLLLQLQKHHPHEGRGGGGGGGGGEKERGRR